MPKVIHVKAAVKDNPVAKKGESYYWWKFRFGGKRYSKTPPRPSQLTQSDKLNNMPDSLQQGPTGELLEGRASGCEEWADALEGVDLDVEEPTEEDAGQELDEGQTKEEKLQELREEHEGKLVEAIDELQGCSYEGE